LRFEAQKHIPFSIDEVNLDAHILKEDLPDNKMLVLVAAAKKDFIAQRLKIIESAGLRPNLVDIDSLSLINAFNFNYPGAEESQHHAVALLNIGAQEANLNILDKAIPRLSRDIHIAGNSFTQKLMEIFSLDFKAAEELKINPDKERSEKVLLAAESVFSNLSAEIRTSFDYYESQAASSVGKILLCGGSSIFPGIKEKLAKILDIAVEYWDPFAKLNVAVNVDSQKLKNLSAQLAVAAGLALRVK
jgi:type IV pilus assembly protein PilM